MAFQSAPDCASAEIVFSQAGRTIENVLNFRKPGGYSQTDIDLLAFRIDQAVGTDWLPIIVDECSYVQTVVTGLQDQADLQAVVTTSAGPGTLADTPLPLNVTAAIQHTTGFTGRSSRGRTFVVGLSDSALATGKQQITTAKRDDWLAAMAALVLNADIAGWNFVVLSRYHNGVARTTAEALDVVSSQFRDLGVDSQRGRLNPAE